MENVLKFPSSTIVDKLVPKAAFVRHSESATALKRLLQDEFESITWLYKLTSDTLNVNPSAHVSEIDVFYCLMKGDGYGLNSFCAMDWLLPRHTFFIIEHGDKIDLLMQSKTRTIVQNSERWEQGVTELLQDVNLNIVQLKLEGFTLDAIYTNLLAQISKREIASIDDYNEQVAEQQRTEKIKRDIERLEVMRAKEAQPRKKYALHQQIKKLKAQL